MFTKDDRETAKQLLSNQRYVELLGKVFLQQEEQLAHETIHDKTNQELGEIVRANALAEHKVKTRYNVLQRLAQDTSGKPNPAAKE